MKNKVILAILAVLVISYLVVMVTRPKEERASLKTEKAVKKIPLKTIEIKSNEINKTANEKNEEPAGLEGKPLSGPQLN